LELWHHPCGYGGGELPWDSATPTNKEYQFWKSSTPIATPPWPKFDLPTLNFFKRLLCPTASKRITIEEIKKHPWDVGKCRNKKRKFSSSVCGEFFFLFEERRKTPPQTPQ